MRALGRLLLPVGVGLLVGLVGLELMARWAWEDAWQDPRRNPPPANLPVLNDVFELARPNAEGLNRGVPYRSNSRGFRSPEYRAKPKPGTFRILVSGDSTTMGAGVLEEDRYSNQLEARLNAEPGDRRYEVINVGLSGQNAVHGATRLGIALDAYGGDLIVYGFSHNDIEGPEYKNQFGGEAPPDDAQRRWDMAAEYESHPLYFWRFLGAWRIARITPPSRRNREYIYNFTQNDEAWQHFLSGLDQFATLGRERGICGQVLIHPYFDHFDESHPFLEVYERVEAAARERSLGVTQALPYFRGRSAWSVWVSLFDGHPNRDGHALLAQALYDGLKALPPRCWQPARSG